MRRGRRPPAGCPASRSSASADAAVREARERVRAAICRTRGFEFPPRRITANLAPGVPAQGRSRIRSGAGRRRPCGERAGPGRAHWNGWAVFGELVAGRRGAPGSAAPWPSPRARGAAGLAGLIVAARARGRGRAGRRARGRRRRRRCARSRELLAARARCGAPDRRPPSRGSAARRRPTSRDVRGQAEAVYALEIAAAGGHNLLLRGAARHRQDDARAPAAGILPPLTARGGAGGHPDPQRRGHAHRGGLIARRPFRAPHHTISAVGAGRRRAAAGAGRGEPGPPRRALPRRAAGVLRARRSRRCASRWRTACVDDRPRPAQRGPSRRGSCSSPRPTRARAGIAGDPRRCRCSGERDRAPPAPAQRSAAGPHRPPVAVRAPAGRRTWRRRRAAGLGAVARAGPRGARAQAARLPGPGSPATRQHATPAACARHARARPAARSALREAYERERAERPRACTEWCAWPARSPTWRRERGRAAARADGAGLRGDGPEPHRRLARARLRRLRRAVCAALAGGASRPSPLPARAGCCDEAVALGDERAGRGARPLAGERRARAARRATPAPRAPCRTAADLDAVCRHDGGYPAALRELAGPARGALSPGAARPARRAGAQPAAAIVGARRASPTAWRSRGRSGAGWPRAGVTVVSGMALGRRRRRARRGAGGRRRHRRRAGRRARTWPIRRASAACTGGSSAGRRGVRAAARVPPRRWCFPARNRTIAGLAGADGRRRGGERRAP